MNNNNTEWQTIHYYQSCLEAAKRCGFKIEQGEDDVIKIIAVKIPYADSICIKRVFGFYATLCWLQGYEQRIFEVKHT